MSRYFSVDYSGGPFVILGPAHIAALAALVILNLWLLRFKGAPESTRSRVRITLAVVLWSAELSWHVWNLVVGTWTMQQMLPLNMCSIFIWLSGLMLLRRDVHIYEFAYFLGIGAAIQYLATPDLGRYGFPHFRFFQAFISHGLLLTAPIYMTVVEGFRPTWKTLVRVVLWTNVYMIIIYFVNSMIDSDFLMLNAKPATPSLLDLLPPWPYYVFAMEAIGLITCVLLYLPFALKDSRARSAAGSGK